MHKSIQQLSEIKLVGIKVRTNNKNEIKFDSSTAKIFPCVRKYFHQKIANDISFRKNPGTTFCIYTDYESDHNGDYTYFIGEEVTDFSEISDNLESLVISPQTYAKFTTGPAPMPNVVKEAWEEINEMSVEVLGGKRAYHADFEIYDERAADHQNIVMDIYISLK
jgi:predicted transcriptional regulator YdeE